LFDYLTGAAPGRRLAWDCGCGSGQATLPLAERFGAVLASDISVAQLARMRPRTNVLRVAAHADTAPLPDACVDLITVAQALHWFAGDAFYAELRRVLKRSGVVAAWTYDLLSVNAPVDARVRQLYDDLSAWWPPARRHVEQGYRSLDFPFETLPAPAFRMTAHWNFERLIGYLGTWSAVAGYRRDRHRDPVAEAADALAAAWGNPQTPLEVRWSLSLRVGRA
jgi:SAM-dependent methyltransferase